MIKIPDKRSFTSDWAPKPSATPIIPALANSGERSIVGNKLRRIVAVVIATIVTFQMVRKRPFNVSVRFLASLGSLFGCLPELTAPAIIRLIIFPTTKYMTTPPSRMKPDLITEFISIVDSITGLTVS